MYCKKCGNKISERSTFCKYCGEKIVDNNTASSEKIFNGNNIQIENVIFFKNKLYLTIAIAIFVVLIICFSSMYFLKKTNYVSDDNETIKNHNKQTQLYYISTLELSFPIYYTYDSLQKKYEGPYDSKEIQNIKNDYYIKINAPEGNMGVSGIEVFNSNKEKISINNEEYCLGSYFFVDNNLYIDTSGYINKINFTNTPTCTIIGDYDIDRLSVKFIYMDNFVNNKTYDVSDYKYYYFANPSFSSRYYISNIDMGMHGVSAENKLIEYDYLYADDSEKSGKIYVRNSKNEM